MLSGACQNPASPCIAIQIQSLPSARMTFRLPSFPAGERRAIHPALPLLLIALWLVTVAAVHAAVPPTLPADARLPTVSVARVPDGLPLIDRLSVFEDETRALTIAQVRTPEQEARFALPDAPLLGKESDRVLWFKLTLQLRDPADARHDWLLVVPTVSTHDLSFYGPYGPDGRALAEPVVTGMRHPWATRPAASEQMAWRLRLPDARPYTVYFRVDSTFARIYAATLWEASDYLQATQDKRMFDGVTYGLLLGLVVYGLVLMLVFGEAIYVYYLLTCLCGLVAVAGINGHLLRYPLAHWPSAAGLAYIMAPPLWALCKLQFGRSLLRLRHFAPRLDRLVQAFMALLVAAALYAIWGEHALWMFRMVQASVLVSTLLLLLGAVVAVRRRYWPAVLYCFGIALLFGGMSAIVVASWGWVAWRPGQMNITQAALAAEMVVFAVAMASRLRLVLRSEQALTARTHQLVEALGTDALTGAASRSGFESRGEEWLNHGEPFALMLLDLDGFKSVNDQHGHAAGDAVLVAVAQQLRQQVRASDLVARLGGDEFAVLVAGDQPRQVLADMATRMAASGALPVDYEGRSIAVGMSLGIACHPDDGTSLAGLLRKADRAMYRAKQQRSGVAYQFANEPTLAQPSAA